MAVTDADLFAAAEAVRARAYAPYSNFHVGTASSPMTAKSMSAAMSKTPPIPSATAPSPRP